MNDLLAQLDRLADGELAAPQRRQLLLWLEAHPQHWRDCSLALLESQSLRAALRDDPRSPQAVPLARPQALTSGSAARWFALAASVLVAFIAGLQMSHVPGTSPVAGGSFADTQSSVPATSSPTGDVLTLWAVDDQGQRQSLRVPLVDANWLDPKLQNQVGSQFNSAVNDSARRQLRDRGYDIESRQRFAPLVMDDGRPLLLPVEDTRVVPVVNTVY